jgi:hypothetical protein
LNTEQLGRTRAELRANLERTGLTEAQVLADLRWSAERLDAALHATGSADPVDVWELRDYLERAVRDAAGNRLRARMWFRLRKAPRHDYSGA